MGSVILLAFQKQPSFWQDHFRWPSLVSVVFSEPYASVIRCRSVRRCRIIEKPRLNTRQELPFNKDIVTRFEESFLVDTCSPANALAPITLKSKGFWLPHGLKA